MRRLILGAALVVGFLLTGVPVGAQTPPLIPTTIEVGVPADINATCSSNVTTQLNDFFKTVPDGETVNMGNAQSCYKVNGTIRIENKAFNIDGNGAMFKGKGGATKKQGAQPALHAPLRLGSRHDRVGSEPDRWATR